MPVLTAPTCFLAASCGDCARVPAVCFLRNFWPQTSKVVKPWKDLATCAKGAAVASRRSSVCNLRLPRVTFLHRHFFSSLLPVVAVVGSHPSACCASSGQSVAKSLKPARTCLFEQNGQPVLVGGVLFKTLASQVCPFSQRHFRFCLLLLVTVLGSHPSASAATSG